MKKLLLAVLLLGWLCPRASAQNACPYWFDSVEPGKNTECSYTSRYTVYRDFVGTPNAFFSRRPIIDVSGNAEQIPDSILEFPILQKPRMALWVQPVQRIGGFKLFLDF